MLLSRTKNQPIDGVLDANFNDTSGWMEQGPEGTSGLMWQPILMGDRDSGPLVMLMDMPPFDWDQFYPADNPDSAHYHRSESFRLAVDVAPERGFTVGAKKYGYGDFYLQPAIIPYRDPPLPGGVATFLVMADRRGAIPMRKWNKDIRDSDELLGKFVDATYYGPTYDGIETANTTDEQALKGLASTAADKIPKAGLSGSVFNPEGATVLSDGSTVTAVFMADKVSGPMVLVTNNAPGAVEAPQASYGTDVARLILKGSCTIGDQAYGQSAVRVTAAGTVEGPVVHGSEGSTQVLCFADRRHWCPQATIEDDATAARLAEIAELIAPYLAQPVG